MNKYKIIAAIALASVIGTGAFFTTHAYAQAPVQSQQESFGHKDTFPVVRRGMFLLKKANTVLSHGEHDFGGHRVAAMHLIEEAQEQLKQAMIYDRQHDRKPRRP